MVIDASAALEWLLQTDKGIRVGDAALAPEQRLHAPHLIDVEVTQTLRHLTRSKAITVRRAEEALADLSALAVERHSHRDLIPRVWELRDALSAYDASYIALAEALDTSLLTCDGKLARSHGHHARIVAV
jgi:predicted nucleic acid-binding protein